MTFPDRLELPIFNVVVIALWTMRDPDVEGSHNATLTEGFAWQGSKKGRDCPSAQWGRHQDRAADQDLDSTTLWQRSKQTSVIHKCHVPALLSLYFLSLDVEVCSETDPSPTPHFLDHSAVGNIGLFSGQFDAHISYCIRIIPMCSIDSWVVGF